MRAVPLLCACFLAACGGEEAVTFRNRNAAEWSERLEAAETRERAFAELREGGVDALPILRELLSGEPTLPALAATELIGGLGPDAASAVGDLASALDRKPLRGIAASALGRIGPRASGALDALRRLWKNDDGIVQMAGALACWEIDRDPGALVLLFSGLKSESFDVRLVAVNSLGRVGEPAVDVLLDTLKDDDPRIRAAAVDSIGAIGPAARKARRTLYALLKDESALVRESAKRALEKTR